MTYLLTPLQLYRREFIKSKTSDEIDQILNDEQLKIVSDQKNQFEEDIHYIFDQQPNTFEYAQKALSLTQSYSWTTTKNKQLRNLFNVHFIDKSNKDQGKLAPQSSPITCSIVALWNLCANITDQRASVLYDRLLFGLNCAQTLVQLTQDYKSELNLKCIYVSEQMMQLLVEIMQAQLTECLAAKTFQQKDGEKFYVRKLRKVEEDETMGLLERARIGYLEAFKSFSNLKSFKNVCNDPQLFLIQRHNACLNLIEYFKTGNIKQLNEYQTNTSKKLLKGDNYLQTTLIDYKYLTSSLLKLDYNSRNALIVSSNEMNELNNVLIKVHHNYAMKRIGNLEVQEALQLVNQANLLLDVDFEQLFNELEQIDIPSVLQKVNKKINTYNNSELENSIIYLKTIKKKSFDCLLKIANLNKNEVLQMHSSLKNECDQLKQTASAIFQSKPLTPMAIAGIARDSDVEEIRNYQKDNNKLIKLIDEQDIVQISSLTTGIVNEQIQKFLVMIGACNIQHAAFYPQLVKRLQIFNETFDKVAKQAELIELREQIRIVVGK
ncbi:Hypothetical_protein [Hexamita inflata]|uniref:Hypothetical_protein n=1 Tax=Hexamita inflata TaxID=28002 RepID=A0AA86Q3Q7_9EUKA|nr:Hypothetical protein HINF_LOCUS39364 [Hexamita inflata]